MAGFLRDLDLFDADFFGIAPREASSLDPQQRLLLETAWQALEHAGHAPEKVYGTSTGVFVGISGSDYGHIEMQDGPGRLGPYFATGTSHSVASGRLPTCSGLKARAFLLTPPARHRWWRFIWRSRA